jgi:hypothetical protein
MMGMAITTIMIHNDGGDVKMMIVMEITITTMMIMMVRTIKTMMNGWPLDKDDNDNDGKYDDYATTNHL